MLKKAMTENAHEFIKSHISSRDKNSLVAVDATVGNGFDFEFLSQLESVKEIIGFDVQSAAISRTYTRMMDCKKPMRLILDSHQSLSKYIHKIDIAMFNLGYLPNGDKEVTTLASESLIAIQKAIELLDARGIITVMTYPGHKEGGVEHDLIDQYFSHDLEKNIIVFELNLKNVRGICPHLYVVQKAK